MAKPKRFNANHPCPVCGGWRTNKRVRCRGYFHSDGSGSFCENFKAERPVEVFGNTLWYHPTDESLVIQPKQREPVATEDLGKRILEREVKHYPQQGIWRPAGQREWFVVYEITPEGRREITRSLREQVALAYLSE